MTRAWVLAGLVCAAATVAGATGGQAETLEDVLSTAYNTNPTLMARRAALRATDEGVPQAKSAWRPTVTLTGSAGRGDYFNNMYAASYPLRKTRTPIQGALSVSESLYRGGRTGAQIRQADDSVQAGRAQLSGTEAQVLLSAATAYLNVVRDEATLNLNINNEQVLRRQLEAAQERFQVGEITRTDVSQAEARLAQASADRTQAEANLKSSRAAFVEVIGRPPESLQAPKAEVTVPASIDDARGAALTGNPSVVAADWTAKAAQDGIDLVGGELLPTVAVTGTLARANETYTNYSRTDGAEVMLTVSIPLYEAGFSYSRLRAQKHVWGQRLIEADQARRDAIQSVTQAWDLLLAARARVQSYGSQIAANQMALAGVEEEAKVGSRTVLDVLNAEQELFTSRVNLVAAKHDEFLEAFQVRAALGDLTAEALKLPVDLYDPARHYQSVSDRWWGTGIEAAPGYAQDDPNGGW